MTGKTIRADLLHAGDKVILWSARRQTGVSHTIKRVTQNPGTVTLWFMDGGREVVAYDQQVSVP